VRDREADRHGILERRGTSRLPESLQIEIDSRCNLRCTMCAVPRMVAARELRTLEPSEFRELLATHFSHARRVMLCGFSEPLMNPHVPELVQIAHSLDKRVNLATNGLLLTPERAESLVAAGLDDVALSFDTTRPETYRLIRGVARLPTLVENLRGLRRAVEQAGARLDIELHAVVSPRNIGEIEALVRFAAAERVQLLTLIREMPIGGQDVRSFTATFAGVDWTATAELARELGVGLLFTDPRPEAVAGCYWALNHSYVSIEGDVSPCQVASVDPEFRFGNLRDASFASIFESERYVAFREKVARHEIPAPCRGCSCVFRSDASQPAGP